MTTAELLQLVAAGVLVVAVYVASRGWGGVEVKHTKHNCASARRIGRRLTAIREAT